MNLVSSNFKVFMFWKTFLIVGRILLNYDVMITGEKYSIIYGSSVEVVALQLLEHPITQRGNDLSSGQRQGQCLWLQCPGTDLCGKIPTPTPVIGASHKQSERKGLGNPGQMVWRFHKPSEEKWLCTNSTLSHDACFRLYISTDFG